MKTFNFIGIVNSLLVGVEVEFLLGRVLDLEKGKDREILES